MFEVPPTKLLTNLPEVARCASFETYDDVSGGDFDAVRIKFALRRGNFLNWGCVLSFVESL